MSNEPDLAARRRALDLSQEQLAHLLGITQGTVSRNETAKEPDRRYELSLDALRSRKESGEDLAATAAMLAREAAEKLARLTRAAA